MMEEEVSRYWETIVETMLDGLMVVDPDGVILSVNRAMEEITGYRKEELIGKPCRVLDCDRCFGTLRQGGKHFCALFTLGEVRHSRCVLRRKDGTPLHVLKNAALLTDREGRVVGGVETLADYTALVTQEDVIRSLRKTLSLEDSFEGIIGKSVPMLRVFDLIRNAAQSEAPVVIYGESGTGKELVASAIHRLSARSDGPFIKVNCAALNESLLESELFGHVKGAFTGADRTRIGRFEAASSGDIFLDEIGDLPPATQVKLLRVLQEKEIEKVGDHKPVAIDVRIIAATNKDLHRLMEEGKFRDDLYYRIGVIPIHLPPLRERKEDLPILVETFLRRIALKSQKEIEGLEEYAMKLLAGYDWPGNVRELINALEYAFVLCPGGLISPSHLPPTLGGTPAAESRPVPARRARGNRVSREELLRVLEETQGNKTEAARVLGVSRVTLWKWLKARQIQVEKKIAG